MDLFLPILFGFALALVGLYLSGRFFGFTAQRPEDYSGQGPQFDLREHLSGPILCEGVIYGPTGRVASRFTADMEARWEGNVGTMTERFRYDSGTVQDRHWTLTLGNDGSIRAEAPDVIGTGHAHPLGDDSKGDTVGFLPGVRGVAGPVQVQNHVVVTRPPGH